MISEELSELVLSFAQAAAYHYEATQAGRRRDINRAADTLDSVYRRIKSYGDVGKTALLKLLDSENLAVSSMAAAYCMHFAPQECKRVFERVVKDPGILGLEAKYALKRFEDGSWQIEPA